MSFFASRLSTITQVPDPTFVGSIADRNSHKGSVYIVVISIVH